MKDISSQLKCLTEEQIKQLKAKLAGKGFRINKQNEVVEIKINKPIEPITKQSHYPISNAQKRLWILHQLNKDDTAYNIFGAFMLEGEFNRDAFEKAYNYILKRHESLRTVFETIDGEPKQRIVETPQKSIHFIDLSMRKNRDQLAEEIANGERLIPFDLEKGPLTRITVLELSKKQHLLLFSMHHIVSDGWSMSIFSSELLNSYHSLRECRVPSMEPLEIQYKEFTVWQNNLLEGIDLEHQKEYWLNKLSGSPSILEIPTDKVRPSQKTFNGDYIRFQISKDTTIALLSFCKENQVSPFITMQALIKVLFYNYSGQEEITLGCPVAGRTHEQLDNQVGLFINSLALRDDIRGQDSFLDFLNQTAITCTEAFQHQDYPFDRLVEELHLGNDLSRTPLFDVMVNFHNEDLTIIDMEGMKVQPYETKDKRCKFDLTFDFFDTPPGLDCTLRYNTDIFGKSSIERMATHFTTLIDSALNNPTAKIKELTIISPKEKHLILNVFNNTETSFPKDKTIVDLFEAQVAETPDRIALIFETIRLTYKELNRQANIIASYLITHHQIQENEFVGIMLNRSEKSIIALLGILKSGGAYVPIEMEYPEERRRYIIEDSNPKVILSEETKGRYVNINEILSDNSKFTDDNPKVKLRPDASLHVVYTSGSSGKPKGIITKHENVINFVEWGKSYFFKGKVKGDFALFTSLCFDSSSTAIYMSLLRGRKLTVFNQTDGVEQLVRRAFESDEIDSMKLTPSQIVLLSNLGIQRSSVRLVIISGEELLSDHVKTLREAAGQDLNIINAYGATEATMTCMAKDIKDPDDRINIGNPNSNVKIYILQDKQLTGIGVPGELCISGAGISKGYLNKPELTAKHYVSNPFIPGEEMYRTGDLAKWLPDGEIEYLGRIDNQINIRGYRVEIDEIEERMLGFEQIAAAAVIAKDDLQGEKTLIAYYTSTAKFELIMLRNFLEKSLPNYMIPAYFVLLNQMPLTTSGKIDRKSLPLPRFKDISSGTSYVSPRCQVEEKLADLWKEILEIRKIGIYDNFFYVGGHSLKAVKLIHLIHKHFKTDVALRTIFEHPTIEQLSQILKTSESKGAYKPLTAVLRQELYDVSNAQKRLWILNQMEGSGIAYNMPAAFTLEGKFYKSAFQEAVNFLVKRHESLRTVFISVNGIPKQRILNKRDIKIEFVDLSHIQDCRDQINKISQKELSLKFDLQKGPLFRFKILKIEPQKHILLFNMHHIISDGWSRDIFTRELLSFYNDFKQGSTPTIAPLRIHYKDYSAWQNALLKNFELDQQKSYWHKKLSGELPILNLPADKTRPSTKTFHGKSIDLSFSAEISSDLNAFCRENGVTLFMMLQALIKILFHRYTGQEDIILGSPVAGRNHADLENQIGFYVNTLAFRDTVKSESSFKEVLQSVKKTCSEAFINQDYPFDQLIEELDIRRDLSHAPIFDVVLALQDIETIGFEFDDLKASPYETENVRSIFDVTLNFYENKDRLHYRLEYNTDLFNDDRMYRMITHIKTLIGSVIKNPLSKVRDLEYIPPKEQALLLKDLNGTSSFYSNDKTIIDLFEEQVETNPDRIAVVFEGTELSYKDLNQKANNIAIYLSENHDIQPDDLIGVLLDRSEKMIIAMLGIMKSGAAYVPIDPAYPNDRISYMLKDSNPKVVLSEENSLYFSGREMVHFSQILRSGRLEENPLRISIGKNLAYMIYTSGSTGNPKGVMVEHQSLLNFYNSMHTAIYQNYHNNLNISLFASFSFDASFQQIVASLLSGHTLHIIPNEIKADPKRLLEFYITNSVDITDGTPAILDIINEEIADYANQLKLKEIVIGGDVFFRSTAKRFLSHFHPSQAPKITNVYGPTECCVNASYYRFQNTDDLDYEILPIGKPLPNYEIYILDKEKKLIPFGFPGEVYISGRSLARGYFNRPNLTEEKFVAHPFQSNEKMYRTGDLARQLPDGNLVFLGRTDYQVKIRGFRIEIGEIEKALIRHPHIISAVVTVNEQETGHKELIAYYVSEKKLPISEIRAFLGKKLPDFMIPSFWIPVESMPLNKIGKIDREALPDPLKVEQIGSVQYIEPRNDEEKLIVDLWQEVLGHQKVGVHDDFFDLGGNSLTAVKFLSRINKKLKKNIGLKNIFSNRTPESLALVVMNSESQTTRPITAVGKRSCYPVSNAQRRLWVLDQLEKDSITYNIPGSFLAEGEFDSDAFEKTYSYLLDRHESLRTVFITENGIPRQKIIEKADSNLKFIDLRANDDPGLEARKLADKEIKTPFNLKTGPLIRFTVIRMDDKKYLVFFNMHHIISDGWSMNVFTKEFLMSYNSFRKSKTPNLVPINIHYKDYSFWQNKRLESKDLDDQKAYWLQKLSGELPILNLPTNKLRPAVQTFQGKSKRFYLPEKTGSDLIRFCKESEVSLFMMLQAVIKVLFYRYTGQNDIIIGSPIAGRVQKELENQIGCYVNLLAFRDMVHAQESFMEVLNKVKKTCTDAFDNQEYPFDRLVEDLDLKKDLSRSPLFDVVLVLQNNKQIPLEISELKITPYEIEQNISKFDIKFDFFEENGGLRYYVEFNSDIYSEDSIERIAAHLNTLVNSIVTNPEIAVSDLELLSKPEKNQILNRFNLTEADYPKEKTLIRLFAEQAEKTPEKPAVICGEVELSYRELDQKSSLVANYLTSHYLIKPDELIGVLLERSENLVVALLGILKTGAAYLPIDPEYPDERISYILEDASPAVVIGNHSNEVFVDIDEILCSSVTTKHPGFIANPDNLAYVIYTSGSTGYPKGVMIENKNVVNYISWAKKFYLKGEKNNFPLYTSISFDLTVTSIFTPLLSGNAVIVFKGGLKDFQLIDILNNEQINLIKVTPAHLKMLKESEIGNSNIHGIIVGGEELDGSLAIAVSEKFEKRADIYNEYGPTETTVGCMIYRFLPEEDRFTSVSIGVPSANVQIYLLDSCMSPVPIGVTGELYIGGDGVGRGYLNRDNLTKERFLENPFCEGTRLYRSGDLAKRSPDGLVHFCGRVDRQVKTRGYRIELGEVENQILKYTTTIEETKLPVVKDPNAENICSICLLTESHPEVKLDSEGQCTICRRFKKREADIKSYFKKENEFLKIINQFRQSSQGKYDCLLLFSGGKDSTYVLYKLVELGLKVLTFTFDNGFISKTAFDNIYNVTKNLNVENIILKSEQMNTIFLESIRSDSNVCNGCWHALNTIGIKIAHEKGIPAIISGLSRGQIIELRLEGLFQKGIYEEAEIDRTLLEFRKSFHSENNKFTKISGNDIEPVVIEQIQFIDYFRYDDTPTHEIKRYLNRKGWSQPADTGFCSSNCLINDVGIYIHLKELQYHSYDIQTSWDIRLGVVNREDAIETCQFEGDLESINSILKTIGYFDSQSINDVVVIDREDSAGNKELCAYLAADENFNINRLKDYLLSVLPGYMIPSEFILIKALPLTPNGKIDKDALPDPKYTLSSTNTEYVPSSNETEAIIIDAWREVLRAERIGVNDNFFDLGGNSLKMITVSTLLNKKLDRDLSLLTLFTYPTVKQLASHITEDNTIFKPDAEENKRIQKRVSRKTTQSASNDIAIIGMSGRFPEAKNISEFWNNLKEGKESIRFFNEAELKDAGVGEDEINNPNYIRAYGILDNKEYFDSGFFAYSPVDAEYIDPQIRIFHEEAWSTLEDAGYNPDTYQGSIGLFAGGSENSIWKVKSLMPASYLSGFERAQLTDMNFLCKRISYKLNLKGPSVVVQTACSTSLTAVVMACENLESNKCDMALAGGVTINSQKSRGYVYTEGLISSADGHCRAFDINATGTVDGEGCGIVLLKRLDEALNDNDNIHAVIKGYGSNNDGSRKVGFTAPSVAGQAELIKTVQKVGNIAPESIGYIEAHGTGTKMGDPIEIEALKKAFHTDQRSYCAVGSVKSNIGHLGNAAGIAGLIKTVLSLKHRRLVPSINITQPNPLLKIEQSPFYLSTKLKEWKKKNNYPRRAGVSSFGMGGANVHVILEEAPESYETIKEKSAEIINLSAKTETSLINYKRTFLKFINANKDISLSDVSYTLNTGRKHFNYRTSYIASSIEGLIEKLEDDVESKSRSIRINDKEKKIVFMFPGQGIHYSQIGSGLYEREKEFRDFADHCIDILKKKRKIDLRNLLFQKGSSTQAKAIINEPHVSACELFIIEVSLANLLIKKGIRPDAVIGHSLGEYAAGWLSGVMSLPDALTLVFDRGLLIKKSPAGAMLNVAIEKRELMPLLNDSVSVAAENSDTMFVLSGAKDALENLNNLLEDKGITTSFLHMQYAFHSRMLDPLLEEFEKTILNKIDFQSPKIPFVSSLTGDFADPNEVKKIEYWIRQFRNTVNFNSGIKQLLKEKDTIYLEVGPGKSLTGLVASLTMKDCTSQSINLMRNPNSFLKDPKEELNDSLYFLHKTSELWLAGAEIDWTKIYKNKTGKRISLPTYEFEKMYYGKLFNVLLNDSSIVKAMSGNKKDDLTSPLSITDSKKELAIHLDNGLHREIRENPKEKLKRIDSIYHDSCDDSDFKANEITITGQQNDEYREEIEYIANEWRNLLGINKFNINDDFFEMGGSSIAMIQLVAKLQSQYKISISELLTLRTLKNIAEHLRKNKSTTQIDMKFTYFKKLTNRNREIENKYKYQINNKINSQKIKKEIKEIDFTRKSNQNEVLLTGATGFLGIYLIKELLSNQCTRVSVLIRNLSKEKAFSRIREHWDYFFDEMFPGNRLNVFCGDIAKPGLGLSKEDWEELSKKVDSVFHSAAIVHHFGDWQDFVDVNVNGTRNILDFVKNGNMSLHHMSTIGVAGGYVPNKEFIIFSEDSLDVQQDIDNPYGKSKFIAEKLVQEARNQGYKCNIYRIGNILFDSDSLIFQKNNRENWFFNSLMALIDLRVFPITKVNDLDVSYVDQVAKSIVKISRIEELLNENFHIFNHKMISFYDFGVAALEKFSDIRILEISELFDYFKDNFNDKKLGRNIQIFLAYLGFYDYTDENNSTIFHIVNEKTNRILKILGFDWKDPDSEILDKFIDKYIKQGIFKRDRESIEFKPELSPTYKAPSNDIERKLVSIWSKLLGLKLIGVDDLFFDLGGNSVKGLVMISEIYKEFGFKLAVRDFHKNLTVSKLAATIAVGDSTETFEILVPIQKKGTKTPLFLIPGVEGDVLNFSAFSKFMGKEQPIFGLQTVGLNGKDKPFDNIEDMAQMYLFEIKKIQKNGPYHIAGHSFGGLVGYETARQMTLVGDKIKTLLVFDENAPHYRDNSKFNMKEFLSVIIQHVFQLHNVKKEPNYEEIYKLKETEIADYLREYFGQHGIYYSKELIQGKWNVIKSNCLITYHPDSVLKVDKAVLFKAKDRRTTNSEQIKDNDLGWNRYFSSKVLIYEIPGNHTTILDPQNVEKIAEVIKDIKVD